MSLTLHGSINPISRPVSDLELTPISSTLTAIPPTTRPPRWARSSSDPRHSAARTSRSRRPRPRSPPQFILHSTGRYVPQVPNLNLANPAFPQKKMKNPRKKKNPKTQTTYPTPFSAVDAPWPLKPPRTADSAAGTGSPWNATATKSDAGSPAPAYSGKPDGPGQVNEFGSRPRHRMNRRVPHSRGNRRRARVRASVRVRRRRERHRDAVRRPFRV